MNQKNDINDNNKRIQRNLENLYSRTKIMISIIGGAGFIGTNIVKCLRKKYEFKILDNGFNNSGHTEFEHLEIGTASNEK